MILYVKVDLVRRHLHEPPTKPNLPILSLLPTNGQVSPSDDIKAHSLECGEKPSTRAYTGRIVFSPGACVWADTSQESWSVPKG